MNKFVCVWQERWSSPSFNF